MMNIDDKPKYNEPKNMIIEPSIIAKELSLFYYFQIKSILFNQTQNEKIQAKLNEFFEKKGKYFKINNQYTIDNIKSIIKNIQYQNGVLAGDILEIILIKIFSKISKLPKEITLEDYIYIDEKGKCSLDKDIIPQIIKKCKEDKRNLKNQFKPEELKNLEK